MGIRGSVRTGVFAAAVVALVVHAAPAPMQAQAPPASATAKTKTTWYFYTVKWGFQNEFLDLFQKNHYPVLEAQRQAGRFVSVRTFVPEFHGDGRADWTFAVELVARTDHTGGPAESELIKKLFPDQATFRKEEQRRFELLIAHWDVPLNDVDFASRPVVGR